MVFVRRYEGHRRTYLAVGGLAIVLLLGVATSAASEENAGNSSPPAQNATQQPPPPEPPPSSQEPKAYIYPYSCDRPKSAEQDNLCIEREAVKAARKQVIWAERTFWLGVAGTFFVIMTLGATTYATFIADRGAKAAEISAKAAADSIKLTRDLTSTQQRAYIYVAEASIRQKDGRFIILARFRNSGYTPAYKYIVRYGIGFDVYPFPAERVAAILERAKIHLSQQTLPASGSTEVVEPFPLDSEHVSAILSGTSALWFYGRLTYVDAFGGSQHTNFRQFCRGKEWLRGAFTVDSEGNDST